MQVSPLRWLTTGLLMILVSVSTLILRELHQLRLVAQAAPLPAAQAASFIRFASLPAAPAETPTPVILVGVEYDGTTRSFGTGNYGMDSPRLAGLPVVTDK